MKNKKLLKLIIVVIILLGCVMGYIFINNNKIKREHIAYVEEHFNKYSITNKEASIYKLENNKLVEYGKVGENIKLVLDEISKDYYKISNLDLYIKYSDVDKVDEFSYSDRYTKYIPFNVNIKTKDITSFYDENDNLVYTINSSYDFPIIISDTDKYGIEFNNQLLYVHKDDVDSHYDNHNTDLSNKKNIRVITYHHFYDPDTESCNQGICLSVYKLEDQFKYLRENDYLTLTLPELELYMDGKLQIPNKSTVLTMDDGTVVNYKAIELLDKYKINATMFIITSWIPADSYQSDYLDLESHTHNMHNQYECPGYGLQGGGILCLSEEKIKEDLKASQDALGGSKYLAYPFFDWNERAIRILKEMGFTMAFVGAAGNDGVSTPGVTDKFKIKRKTMFSDVSLNEFINEYLN